MRVVCQTAAAGIFLLPPLTSAECRIDDNSFDQAAHILVNGIINRPVPELVFNIPGAGLGDGNRIFSDTVNAGGGNNTLDNHVRFRLNVKEKNTRVALYNDTSAPLTCVNCASAITIPFAEIGWVVGNSSESIGDDPGAGQFTAGTQHWITGRKTGNSDKNSNHVFNLQFHFANDKIYPAGTYKGRFLTRGVPQ